MSSRGPAIWRRFAMAVALSSSALAAGGCDPEIRRQSCTRDDQCTLPELCAADGLCARPAPAGAGSHCRHDHHCSTGRCLDLGQGPLCVEPCEASEGCSADQICSVRQATPQPPGPAGLWLLCSPAGNGARYLGEACLEDGDCRSGLCVEQRCSVPCQTLCPGLLSCQPGAISRAGGLTLEHSFCRPSGPLRVVELGAVATTAAGSAELTLQLGEADVKGGVIIFADDKDNLLVGIRRLLAPDGARLLDLDDSSGALARGSVYHGTGTALLPGTEAAAAALRPGAYKVSLGTYAPGSTGSLVPVAGAVERVAAVMRRDGGRGGLLDLNIAFSPGTGLKATQAAADPYVVTALARLDELLRSLMGVAVGEVRYADLPAGHDEVLDGEAARTICSTASSAGPNGVSINLFWVKTLSFAAGFSGGIPGPPGLVGRPFSGIVLQKQATASVMGTLMAHEIAHFLGLWHTTEPTGQGDPIGDTPVCPPGTAKASCPDYSNLMFPFFSTTEPLRLSPGQQAVVRASPWLYEVAYPDVCGAGVPAVDVGVHGFASGSIAGAGSLAGSCGGSGHGERVHLLRLAVGAKALEVEARGEGFDPVVYVRRDRCTDEAAEVACAAGSAGTARAKLDAPAAGAYFVIVDGKEASGSYDLAVQVTR